MTDTRLRECSHGHIAPMAPEFPGWACLHCGQSFALAASLRDDSMELAHIVHGASDLGWNLSMELAERLWTAGVRVVEDER